jgi:putative transposase
MHGISDAIFYNWRSKYGGMEVSDATRLKDLEKENRRLKHMLTDIMLESQAIKNVLSKKWSDSTSRWTPLPFG